MDKLKQLASGNDSTVYSSPDGYIVKFYDGVINGLNLQDRLDVLNKYASDTLKAAEILRNEKNTFFFKSLNYDLQMIIVPQGEVTLMFPDHVDVLPRWGYAEYAAMKGQRLVLGDNVATILDDYDHNISDSPFHESINTFYSSLKHSMRNVQELLNEHLGLDIIIGYANIKPSINEDKKQITLEVTDLADSLLVLYK